MTRLTHIGLCSFSVAVLVLYSVSVSANVIVGKAAIPENYYDAVDHTKNAENILAALNTIIDGHTVISYSGLEPYYEQTDFYADTLWDMYSTCRFTMDDANVPQKAVCDGWNKEHVVCQSWLGSGPMVSDLFNVYPTDARINNLRGNLPYGQVSSHDGFTKDPNHHGLGKLGPSVVGIGKVYQPDDRYKGDFARTFFYMVARYRNNILNNGNGSQMFTSNPTDLTTYSLNFLLEWHRNDPVSQKEIDRNQAVYGIQKNRNPFIDYPELVEYIWGDKKGQQIDLSAMTPTCEGGGYTPGKDTKYGVSWSVCGDIIAVDSVIENRAIASLPASPASCVELSETFVGWTNEPILSASDQAPAVLYKSLSDFPVVTADVTYYAVFAHAEAGASVEPAVYTYDEQHQEGWTNNATFTTYWLLDEGKALVSPEVDLAGLSSIEVSMRTYGGAEYCNLNVSAAGQTIATITATNGKTLSDYTWTNTAALTGVAPLTFSTTYGAKKGIGVTRVVINATGVGTIYSAFVTSGEPQAIPEIGQQQKANSQKLIVNGHLLIQRGDQLYTITGQPIHR